VQNLVRALAGKELPDKLLNWYQRTLLPEAEFFAEFHLPRTIYLDELFSMPQNEFLGQADIAMGLGESEPEPITLQAISYDKVDADTLVKAYRKQIRQQQQAREKAAEADKKASRTAPKRVIGGKLARYRAVDDIAQAVGRTVRVRTTRGRVIKGVVQKVTDNTAVIRVDYLTGSAEFNLPRKEIKTVEVLKLR